MFGYWLSMPRELLTNSPISSRQWTPPPQWVRKAFSLSDSYSTEQRWEYTELKGTVLHYSWPSFTKGKVSSQVALTHIQPAVWQPGWRLWKHPPTKQLGWLASWVAVPTRGRLYICWREEGERWGTCGRWSKGQRQKESWDQTVCSKVHHIMPYKMVQS